MKKDASDYRSFFYMDQDVVHVPRERFAELINDRSKLLVENEFLRELLESAKQKLAALKVGVEH